MRCLVVYFSRKGYTAAYAKNIAAQQHADLLELRTPERTRGIAGFWWCGRFGMLRREMPLCPLSIDPSAYERVVLCAPVWVFSMAAPMWAFLRRYGRQISSLDCVLLHFSSPMRYSRTLKQIDHILGKPHHTFISVQCVLGHILREKSFPTLSK